ncbi:MAG: EamA/RhaT family transporter, partial [Pseudomonadota bacterium]
EAVRVQPFVYLQMVFGTIVGWFIFGEHVDALTILGMGMIIGAGLYAIWREIYVTAVKPRTR